MPTVEGVGAKKWSPTHTHTHKRLGVLFAKTHLSPDSPGVKKAIGALNHNSTVSPKCDNPPFSGLLLQTIAKKRVKKKKKKNRKATTKTKRIPFSGIPTPSTLFTEPRNLPCALHVPQSPSSLAAQLCCSGFF